MRYGRLRVFGVKKPSNLDSLLTGEMRVGLYWCSFFLVVDGAQCLRISPPFFLKKVAL